MNLLSVTGVSHDYPHHGRVLPEIQLALASGERSEEHTSELQSP